MFRRLHLSQFSANHACRSEGAVQRMMDHACTGDGGDPEEQRNCDRKHL
jgi:hypothetical protein